MDDDEEHLVVLGWGGARVLQRQQLLKIETVGVSQRRHVAKLHAVPRPSITRWWHSGRRGDRKSARKVSLSLTSAIASLFRLMRWFMAYSPRCHEQLY
jgi:hypothetical protein